MITSRAQRLDYARAHYSLNRADYKERARVNTDKARKNLRAAVSAYLSEHPCVDCGENDPLVLEFDHVRDRKKANVTDMIRRGCSWRAIRREIEKCDVRCANCHRRKTTRTARQNHRIESPASFPKDKRQFRLEGL